VLEDDLSDRDAAQAIDFGTIVRWARRRHGVISEEFVTLAPAMYRVIATTV
jgi:hypothetical protein